MTDAEFRVVREWLGLTEAALAELLGVDIRTVRRWSAGAASIPPGIASAMEDLEQVAAARVAAGVQALHDAADAVLVTFRTDADYWTAHPDARPLPASWHRAIVARVVQDVPGVEITFSA